MIQRICDVVCEKGSIDLYSIKVIAGFTKDDKSGFDRDCGYFENV